MFWICNQRERERGEYLQIKIKMSINASRNSTTAKKVLQFFFSYESTNLAAYHQVNDWYQYVRYFFWIFFFCSIPVLFHWFWIERDFCDFIVSFTYVPISRYSHILREWYTQYTHFRCTIECNFNECESPTGFFFLFRIV